MAHTAVGMASTFSQWLRRYLQRHNFDHVTPHGLRHFVQQPCIAAGKRSGCVPGLPGPDQVAGPTQFKVLPGNFKPVIGAAQDLQLIRRI